ncbi:hypothetical protein [Bacillus alkalicellulosilyticus]|uniref:hypothetical protein n=1 Tax=Alkalihalobacterium alkalicellulosilyticum TaxID=1912214 RepID=UPI001482C0EE|nr:hypothetical protein [Bacillus alkalicellulosilyticus]
MVNQNFEEFSKTQQKHRSPYLAGGKDKHEDENSEDALNTRTTQSNVGATGRDKHLKGE